MTDLARSRRIHVVGAGGAGMSGLAKILAQMGHDVSGSDLKPGPMFDRLGDLGIDTWIGHEPDRAAAADLVVASSAVPDGDPELRAAAAAGVEVWRRPRLLEALSAAMPAIGITGTHGKTTTTALAVTALRAGGHDPTFLLGGDLVDLNTNAHLGDPDLFVLETDEAFGTFLSISLRGLLITNIDSDHLDHYRSFEALEAAFHRVAAATRGPVVVGVDDEGGRRLAARSDVITFGTAPDADWVVGDVSHREWNVSFLLRGSVGEAAVSLPRPGLHMALNAAGALSLLAELEFDLETAARGLATFAGVRRRFELRARIDGVTVVDDYAHHPTEVSATLAAVRRGSWEKVWAVFQPHRYSRTAELAAEFGPVLAEADRVVVTDVYGADEPPEPGVTGKMVADAVAAAGAGDVDYVARRRDLAAHVAAEARAGDLVLLLGAGDITTVADELAELLGARQ